MFKKKKSSNSNFKPIQKGLYAWNSLHAGSFLLYVESLKDCYRFLFLPGPSDYYLTFEDFDKGMKTNILEFVDTLPNDVFEESLKLSLLCPPENFKIVSNEIQ